VDKIKRCSGKRQFFVSNDRAHGSTDV